MWDNIDKLPDVHEEKPSIPISINSVGITGYRVKATICNRECREYHLSLEIYVDLPQTKRGVHISRFIEAVEETISKNHRDIWSLLREIALKSLEKHVYANKVEVYGSTELIIESNNVVSVKQGVILGRGNDTRHYLSLSFKGVTACPCVQKIYSYVEKTPLSNTPTHLQRTILKIEVETRGDSVLDPIEVYMVSRKAFSGVLRDKLKRYEEYLQVKEIVGNPRFVEDVVRYAAKALYDVFSDKLPRDTRLVIEARSEESIHVYDTYARLETTIEELENVL